VLVDRGSHSHAFRFVFIGRRACLGSRISLEYYSAPPTGIIFYSLSRGACLGAHISLEYYSAPPTGTPCLPWYLIISQRPILIDQWVTRAWLTGG
jgi:hypothetical protein